MNQPALGKKILELRKAKGYTQEELVNKCKLNIRTLQRIESGEVEPRSYTIKAIFTALDYQDEIGDVPVEVNPVRPTMDKISIFTSRMYEYVIDLFNFKTNKMKKLTILTTLVLCIIFAGTTLMRAQKAENTNQLLGTWILCNAQGESIYPAENEVEIKAITPETFTVIAVNKEKKTLMPELMGTYTLDKDTYTETVTQSHPNIVGYVGKVNIFKITFKGDLLILEGQNNTFNQTWKKVNPEDLKVTGAEKK